MSFKVLLRGSVMGLAALTILNSANWFADGAPRIVQPSQTVVRQHQSAPSADHDFCPFSDVDLRSVRQLIENTVSSSTTAQPMVEEIVPVIDLSTFRPEPRPAIQQQAQPRTSEIGNWDRSTHRRRGVDSQIEHRQDAKAAAKAQAPKVRTHYYTGNIVSQGEYISIGDLDIFRNAASFNLDTNMLERQRQWFADVEKIKAEAAQKKICKTVTRGRGANRYTEEVCKPIISKLALPKEPVDELRSTGSLRRDSLIANTYRHFAGPKPHGWEEFVKRVRDAGGERRMIETASSIVNSAMAGHYVGSRGSEWVLTPAEGFGKIGLCRDYAFWKYLLLVEAGFPAERLRFATLLPLNPERHAEFHVVLVGQTKSGKRYVLNMDSQKTYTGPLVSEVSDPKAVVATRGTIWYGNLAESHDVGPASAAMKKTMIAATPRTSNEAGDD